MLFKKTRLFFMPALVARFCLPFLGLSFSSSATDLPTTVVTSSLTSSPSSSPQEIPQPTLPVVAMGLPEAPLKIVMFHSLNCSHCKAFKDEVFPKIKKQFIDQGLVHFTFIDFPTDRSALDAAKVAWEARDVQTYETVSGLLTINYNTWAGQSEWQKDLCKIVTENQLMTEEQCTKSLADDALEEEILRTAFEAQQKYKIDYAPAFLFNGRLKQSIGLLSEADIEAELKQINLANGLLKSR